MGLRPFNPEFVERTNSKMVLIPSHRSQPRTVRSRSNGHCSTQAKHIHHVILAGLLHLPPKRGLQRTPCKDGAVGGQMTQHDTLTIGSKDHVMFAHHVTASNGSEPDIADPASTGDAISAPVCDIIERHPPPLGGGLAQHEGRAGGCVDLVAVMRLDHFDVEIRIQRSGDASGQANQKIDAKAHIACSNNHRVAGCSCNFLQILRLEAGGANNMHGPGLRSEGREFHAGRWRGEVDNGLCIGAARSRLGWSGSWRGDGWGCERHNRF